MDKRQPESVKNEIEIVKRFASVVREIGIPVEEVYVFGSRIRGGAHKWSD